MKSRFYFSQSLNPFFSLFVWRLWRRQLRRPRESNDSAIQESTFSDDFTVHFIIYSTIHFGGTPREDHIRGERNCASPKSNFVTLT